MTYNAIKDKASSFSMMGVSNMGVAILSVVVKGCLSSNSFFGFLWIVGNVFFIMLALLLRFKIKNKGA